VTGRPLVVLGLMSGTSVDAVDAAVVQIATEDDDMLALRVLGYHEQPIEEDLRQRIHAVFDPLASQVQQICELNVRVAGAFAEAGAAAIALAGVQPDLVASHGQTIWHEVRPGHVRSTLQIGEPSVLAERLGATVVADFRPRDIAAGGQGAPLSSWADALLFGDEHLARAVQNIGGIANLTWVPPGSQWGAMLAFDTGPGNALIDHAIWRLTGGAQRYDQDGALAGSGRVTDDLLAELLGMPYFVELPPKSTGRELFGAQLVEPLLERGLRPADIVATLTAFTAHSIADQYRRFLPGTPDEVVLGGGGSRNPVLVGLLTQLLDPARLRLHEEFGLPSLGREAVYFALLGYEALHGRPNTIPSCTGASHAVPMGKLVPGPNYRALLARVLASSDRPSRRLKVLSRPE
jgi:anhydro-N-acetylmuramic acid kinase